MMSKRIYLDRAPANAFIDAHLTFQNRSYHSGNMIVPGRRITEGEILGLKLELDYPPLSNLYTHFREYYKDEFTPRELEIFMLGALTTGKTFIEHAELLELEEKVLFENLRPENEDYLGDHQAA